MNNQWIVVYYHNRRGERVVRDEIEAFGLDNAAKIASVINLLERFGLNLRGRFVKHVEGKIWELRVDSYRVLYFAFQQHRFVILRAFMKKTDKTPGKEIRIAWNRLQDYIIRFKEIDDEKR